MNLLITGAWQNAGANLERIRNMGHCVAFLQQEKDPLPCEADWVEGVVCNGLFLHHPIEAFPNLKYIQLTSAGYDRVPVEYIQRHGITIHNARGVYSVPMAEYAVGGVLELYKQFPVFRENKKNHLWEKRRNLLELAGKTVCIVGCGSVGGECAKRFSAFGCRVIGIASSRREQPFFREVREETALDSALAESDVVVLTVPLTEKTHHLMNVERFTAMRRGAVLVNIARGAVVDTRALEQALKQNHLAGAVLDVFEEEPLSPDSPLWDLENVVMTPHNSFVGDGVQERLAQCICDKLEQSKQNCY